MKKLLLYILVSVISWPLFSEPLYSPTWGFKIDLPEGYEYSSGDGISKFSFSGPMNAQFDLTIYKDTYASMKNLVDDVHLRLKNQGEVSYFEYREKLAALIEIRTSDFTGWGLCVELEAEAGKNQPLLLALAYGTARNANLELYHLSALDSIAPSRSEFRYPGPIVEFGYPRGEYKKIPVANTGLEVFIRENDAEAAQALVDREFALLRNYLFLDTWKEAWIRYYRTIYRDSFDRLTDAAFQLERAWQVPKAQGNSSLDFAGKALTYVQGFKYERNLEGSDFMNLVSAVTGGSGDCDSRAMLWAIILTQANIPAAIMVSREHSHAMGLADIEGQGARFQTGGKKWLVAETTATVGIGLIAQEQSAIEAWLGVLFE